MDNQGEQRYDFGDADVWVETPIQTPDPQNLPPDLQQAARRIKRRKFLVGLGIAGIGLAGGGYAGYQLLGNLLHPNHFSLTGPLTTQNDIVAYTKGKLSPGWQDWSWAYRQLNSQAVLYQNQPTILMALDSWGALFLQAPNALDLTDYGYLQFYVNGGDGSNQKANALFRVGSSYTGAADIGLYTQDGSISSNTWKLTRIPLKAMQAEKLTVSGILLQDASGGHQSNISIADLRIVYAPDQTPPHLVQALAYDLGTITLVFDKRMQPNDTQSTRFYSISSSDPAYANAQAPLSAHYHSVAQSVSLIVPHTMGANGLYTVTLGSIRDKYGVTLPSPSVAHVTAQPLTLKIDAAQGRQAISPLIYGLAEADSSTLQGLHPTINRWGGNQTTRYNWKLGNAFSAARDYEFRNGSYNQDTPADKQPSGVADQFIATNQAAGAATIITVPNIGWVARDANLSTYSTNVPQVGGPPISPGSDVINGYNPTDNRNLTCVPSRARKGAPLADPPDVTDPGVAQDEWVYHLTNRFGPAANGGVRYYAMDNEPDLWFATHTDIRPAEIGYDQMRDIFLSYATAVKSVDPTAQVTGPVLSGWLGYLYSSLDRSDDNFRTKADYHAHGDQYFLPWWLAQIRAHDERAGQRSLDVLDIHYYPQATGVFSDAVDVDTNTQRLLSVRALWDPDFKDSSWIGDTIQLIPRMKKWIQQYYPGTKLGITEWNFGAEKNINGALAAAEVLGIFGREGVDLACYWAYPPQNSPTYSVWQLFRNYDGQGSSFGSTSIQAVSSNYDLISCYASQDSATGALLVMVLNKSQVADLTPSIQIANASVRQAQVYQVSADTPQITRLADASASGGALALTLPASSITLLRLIG